MSHFTVSPGISEGLTHLPIAPYKIGLWIISHPFLSTHIASPPLSTTVIPDHMTWLQMTGSGGASGVTIEDLRRFWGSTFRLRLKSQLLDTLVLKSPLGFPGGLNGKEAACNVREPDLIPGRSPGEGNGYSLQYSCRRIP